MKKLVAPILVPVDLGPNTDGLLETAAHLAVVLQSKLRLLFVLEEVEHSPAASQLLGRAASERLAELHRRLVGGGVSCDPPTQLVGRPFEAIVRAADHSNAHLIALGAGGSTKGVCPGLGTTTSRVMRRTAKPVLAVRPGWPPAIQRILCPVDGSNASARGLRNAILLARGLHARLTVLFVVPEFVGHPAMVGLPAHGMARIAAEYERYERMEREQFEKFLGGFELGGLVWDKEVHYGRPAEEIVRLANDAKYDLIVMGSTGRSGLPRLLLGSTAEKVAHRAACSLLTVKRDDVVGTHLEANVSELNRLLAEGEQLLEMGLNEEAIDRFDQCLLKDPYLARAIESQATAYERLGHVERAGELREQAALIRRELWQQGIPTEAVSTA